MTFAVKNSGSPRPLARRLLRWTLQASLAACLLLQLRVLHDGGVRLPAFAQELLARRLAERGLLFSADEIWLDPRGRVLVLRPRLALEGHDGPFATARALSLQLRRRDLLDGADALRKAEFTGLSLLLPAIVSPTGAPQPLLEAGEFRLTRAAPDAPWLVDQASARFLSVPTAFEGLLPASPADTPRRPPAEIARQILRESARAYRHLATLPLHSLRVLRVRLDPATVALSAELEHLQIPPHPALPARLAGATLDQVRLHLALPFARPPASPPPAELHLFARDFTAPAQAAAPGLRGRHLALRLSPGPALDADLALARLETDDPRLPPLPLVARARFTTAERLLALDLSTRLSDAAWHARFTGSLADRSGELAATGALTPALLEFVRPFLPEKARPILELTDPLALDLHARFSPGWQTPLVTARASSGRAVAGRVPFDRAAALLHYQPAAKILRADDLLLAQGDSLARGSYTMDTETLAYRFLLAGSFRPSSINPWFSGWWTRFWENFSFGAAPPAADVDIQGVWRDPDLTTLFIGADSGPMHLRALELDRLSTRLHVSTSSFDILAFRAASGPYLAHGGFRQLNAPDGRWTRLDFDIRSDFPLDALPRLFPKEAPEFTAPFAFVSAPRIHLAGQALGPASATPGSQRYELRLASSGPVRYEGFPLDHLAVRVLRRDDEIQLRELEAGFAGGLATGTATLSGPADKRWLAFDLALARADIDLAQTRWREFQATRPGALPAPAPAAPPAKPAKKEKLPAGEKDPKALGGHLDLRLSATGPLKDPLAYSGGGEARIGGADLAKIRLMGPFSSLLGELGLGFTTVALTEAEARLTLDREKLVFEELRLTGPSALVEAKGDYSLAASSLNFTARLRPFEQREGILGSTANIVTSPLSSALEIELNGTLDEPTWIFAYGPRKWIRKITGL